mgnify:CR=1 FL=1
MIQGKPNNFSIEEALKKSFIKSQAYGWCIYLAYMQFVNFGIPKENIRLRQHHPEEKAFYADDAWDIEIKLNTKGVKIRLIKMPNNNEVIVFALVSFQFILP